MHFHLGIFFNSVFFFVFWLFIFILFLFFSKRLHQINGLGERFALQRIPRGCSPLAPNGSITVGGTLSQARNLG